MFYYKIKKFIVPLVAISAFVFATPAYSKTPDESEFKAATNLGEWIASWIMQLDPVPASLAVFSVYANEPLDQDYAAIVETEIHKNLHKQGMEKVVSCSECRSVQYVVDGEMLVVRKGAPDADTMNKIWKKQAVDAFLTVDIYRTMINVTAQVTAFDGQTGRILGAERFNMPAVTVSDKNVQLLIVGGAGSIPNNPDPTSSYTMSFSISLLEELGFGKGGLNLGMVMGPSLLIYVNPTLAFRGRFGSSAMTYSLNLGGGFGLNGGSKGIPFKASYEVYIGSFTVVGLDAIYYLPQGTSTGIFTSYIGAHMGISFGR